jgi:hypothetical protein
MGEKGIICVNLLLYLFISIKLELLFNSNFIKNLCKLKYIFILNVIQRKNYYTFK